MSLDLSTLRAAYDAGETPSAILDRVCDRIEEAGLRPVWISLVPREAVQARAREIERGDRTKMPLYGTPFAVKDNMDVADMETTAGCPSYAYMPSETATVVRRLEAAGAILVGKTNMDQFATGLVGVRSPYGACSSVFDARYVSGGSSSGSAVAVASGLVSFALGTDTAGSGRVPAAFNNLVGLKPTRGSLSAAGVVPACRSLDCVSIFARTCRDANQVFQAARGFDPSDPYSRASAGDDTPAPWLGGPFRFGILSEQDREFFGDAEAEGLYDASIRALEALGGTAFEFDYAPFREAAALLYAGPWVAERLAAIRPFFEAHAADMDPTVRTIIGGATKFSAADAYEGEYKLRELRRRTDTVWEGGDVLLLPTTGTTYTIEEVKADPIRLNANLGHYTNFVNLLDLAAVALPAGFRPSNGLPFGVSLIGLAGTDVALLTLADRLSPPAPIQGSWNPPATRCFPPETGGGGGSDNTPSAGVGTPSLLRFGEGGEERAGRASLRLPRIGAGGPPPGCTLLAVVGAHLSGQPLNGQLTERGARLVHTTKSTPGYRLYALPDTTPPKPGLVRDPAFAGPGIELEVWAIPTREFGGFVAAVPAPLGIGSVELADGTSVKGFICEPFAVAGAQEITALGGWRAYLAQGHEI